MVPLEQEKLNIATHCNICNETVVPWPDINTLWAHCCKNGSTWFHRHCIQGLALTSETFKCPVCNNVKTFVSSMIHQGIYIPSIRWEIEICKLCRCEQVKCKDKIKSIILVSGCGMCIFRENPDGNNSTQLPDSRTVAEEFKKARKLLDLYTDEIAQPGCSTARYSISIPEYSPTEVGRNIRGAKISTLDKNKATTSYCGPVTRKRSRASRDPDQLRQETLKQAKVNLKRISTEIDRASSVNASPYITRSRVKEQRKGANESNNLQTKKKEN